MDTQIKTNKQSTLLETQNINNGHRLLYIATVELGLEIVVGVQIDADGIIVREIKGLSLAGVKKALYSKLFLKKAS